jgi:hypothetical protein
MLKIFSVRYFAAALLLGAAAIAPAQADPVAVQYYGPEWFTGDVFVGVGLQPRPGVRNEIHHSVWIKPSLPCVLVARR